MAANLSITFLGTSSAQPSKTRNMSGLCLNAQSSFYLFDCGEGTQHQIQKTSDVKFTKLRAVFITHTHGDHIFGLPGFLCTASGGNTDEEKVVDIVGPKGTRLFIRNSLSLSYSFLSYRLRIHELLPDDQEDETGSCSEEGILSYEIMGENIKPGPNGIWEIPTFEPSIYENIKAGPLDHPAPSVGYVLQEVSLPGSLDAKKIVPILMKNKLQLKEKGIGNPMMLMKDLKEGKIVELPDGTIIDPSTVTGPEKKGRKISILGDSSNSSRMIDIALNSDVVVHEATNAKVGDEEKSFEEVEQTTVEHGHSTPQMAGKFATAVNAKLLLLNHFSSRYKGDDSEESLSLMKEIENLAVENFDGKVIAVRDLMTIPIIRPENN